MLGTSDNKHNSSPSVKEMPTLLGFEQRLNEFEQESKLTEGWKSFLSKKINVNQKRTQATLEFDAVDRRQTLWLHQGYEIFNPLNMLYPIQQSYWFKYTVEKLDNFTHRYNPLKFIFPKFFKKKSISAHQFGLCVFEFALANDLSKTEYFYVPSITCTTLNKNIVTDACLENFFKHNKLFQIYKDQIAFIGYNGKIQNNTGLSGNVPDLMKYYIENPQFMCSSEQIINFIHEFEHSLKNELKILI